MILKPRTIVVIAPTVSPPQDTYKASFEAHLSSRFTPEVVCADADPSLDTPLIDLRDGLRLAMRSLEHSFSGRQDLEYGVYVLPMLMQRDASANANTKPYPIIIITIRSWQRTEWAVAYPLESTVPRLVVEEVASSITTVMTERNSSDCSDPAEQIAFARLIDGIREGINGAIMATPPSH
jgi:hypothetical protein